MPVIDGREQELQGLMHVANLMVVAARTAPKSGGVDDVFTAVVYGDEKENIAVEMERLAETLNNKVYARDAGSVRKSEVIVLIGVRGTKRFLTDCGGCGYRTCAEFQKAPKQSWGGF